MAARADGVGHDRLYHFIGSGVWDAEPLEAALLMAVANRLVGGEDAFLVVDETALPKKGEAWSAWPGNPRPRWARVPTAGRWCR